MNCERHMSCEKPKIKKCLNEEGLLFFTQVLHDKIQAQINDAINDAVASATIVPKSNIIARINQLIEDGTITTKEDVDAQIAELKALIEQAKEEAANDAMVALSANIRSIVEGYAQNYLQTHHEDPDIDELVAAILENSAFKGKYVKKTGDTVTGDLIITGNTTSDKFITSSGVTFF